MATLTCVGDTPEARDGRRVGECLLWESSLASIAQVHPGWSLRVVVDVGYLSGGAYRCAAEFNPHILILTHSDLDHIGGALAFLKATSLRGATARLREVWLPYEWVLLQRAIEATNPTAATSNASSGREFGSPFLQSEELLAAVHGHHEGMPLGQCEPLTFSASVLGDGRHRGVKVTSEHQSATGDLATMLTRQATEIATVIEGERNRSSVAGAPSWAEPRDSSQAAEDVIRKAKRLMGILDQAHKLGVIVRTFSVDGIQVKPTWSYAGFGGALTIANAVEVEVSSTLRVSHVPEAILLLTRLTVQNRRALMPFLWETCSGRLLKGPNRGQAPDEWVIAFENGADSPNPWGVLVASDSAGEPAGVPSRRTLGGGRTVGKHKTAPVSGLPWSAVAAMTARTTDQQPKITSQYGASLSNTWRLPVGRSR